jgi:hypothetical protein
VLPLYSVSGAGLFVVTSSLRNLPTRVALFRDALIAELSALDPVSNLTGRL